jgi:hypothetical protein
MRHRYSYNHRRGRRLMRGKLSRRQWRTHAKRQFRRRR